jgi:hypothetical protein
VVEQLMSEVNWGRTIGPHAPLWSEAQPEAAHAASELHDDDEDDGGVIVTALGAGLLTLLAVGVAALLWSVW